MESLMLKIRLSVLEGVLINTPEIKERYLKVFKNLQDDIIKSSSPELDLSILTEKLTQHLQSIESFDVQKS
jgi:hypothetical protein